MKNIIYTVLLCITSIAFSQEQKTTKTITTNAIVTFGRYGLDCAGRGVCSFTKTENKREANTTINYNKDHTITLIIDRTKITTTDAIKILGQPVTEQFKASDLTFAMEDHFNLEPELKTSLKTSKQITKIAKGNYPIQITKNHFIITLKLE